jgi:hypothetical protein
MIATLPVAIDHAAQLYINRQAYPCSYQDSVSLETNRNILKENNNNPDIHRKYLVSRIHNRWRKQVHQAIVSS